VRPADARSVGGGQAARSSWRSVRRPPGPGQAAHAAAGSTRRCPARRRRGAPLPVRAGQRSPAPPPPPPPPVRMARTGLLVDPTRLRPGRDRRSPQAGGPGLHQPRRPFAVPQPARSERARADLGDARPRPSSSGAPRGRPRQRRAGRGGGRMITRSGRLPGSVGPRPSRQCARRVAVDPVPGHGGRDSSQVLPPSRVPARHLRPEPLQPLARPWVRLAEQKTAVTGRTRPQPAVRLPAAPSGGGSAPGQQRGPQAGETAPTRPVGGGGLAQSAGPAPGVRRSARSSRPASRRAAPPGRAATTETA